MSANLETLFEVALVVAIFWMFVSMYCFLMMAWASRNAMRMVVAWYQDWFDSVFEEGDSPESSSEEGSTSDSSGNAGTGTRSPAAATPAAPAPARAAHEEPANPNPATGAGSKVGFQRRKRI
jgi:hypothetical protein